MKTYPPSPFSIASEQVVQAQLDAYNARNLEAWLDTYSEDAEQFMLHMGSLAKGREAITHFQVEATFGRDKEGKALVTLVRCSLETGRTHQIRVHLEHLGYPVVGDSIYGKRQNTRLREATGYAAPRQMLHAAKLAFAFRQRFHKDVVIDIVCYRRHGHNEGDDPSYTQPQMYKNIAQHRPIAKLYVEELVSRGALTLDEADSIRRASSFHSDRCRWWLEPSASAKGLPMKFARSP